MRTMVAWQELVSLCFEVKRDRGNEVESLEDSQEVLTVASDLWSQNKAELRSASRSDAKAYIERNA